MVLTNPKPSSHEKIAKKLFHLQRRRNPRLRMNDRNLPLKKALLRIPTISALLNRFENLWSQVGQGNTSAEVTLAKLYLIGGGVTKNCDQARVLLRAAAKKGNPEASSKLSQITRQGCP